MDYTKKLHLSSQCELPLASRLERQKKSFLSHSLNGMLDRVNVLGSSNSGHTGCVNALSWAADGEFLISGGDDTTVRIWQMDASDTTTQYPFACKSLIYTGHQGNIFNTQMLPNSSRLVTVAADKQVRLFNAEDAVSQSSHRATYTAREACVRVLRCHSDRCKRVITEYSPDLFLTVAEDGCVRQHDLRTSHACGSACPPPLIKLHHSLSTIALSPLTPHQLVVAGKSPYAYLFDRRHSGRVLDEEWGRVPDATADDMVTCVRRFGRSSALKKRRGSDHITGARVSANNGHEVLLSYGSDAVYLYSTRDLPESDQASTTSILPSDSKRTGSTTSEATNDPLPLPEIDVDEGDDDDRSTSDRTEQDEDEDLRNDFSYHPKVPVILPRRRFVGACNVDTIKDVNFLGPNDEYVTSGSDDGNFFLWQKHTGKVAGVYEGDGSVVNVIEGHQHLPVIAVSGIDKTVKLFAPVPGNKTSRFSRMHNLEAITQRNAEATRRPLTLRSEIAYLLYRYHGIIVSGLSRGDS